MSRRQMVGTGWKMNHTVKEAQAYVAQLLRLIDPDIAKHIDIFMLPPFTALHAVHAALGDSGIAIGAQNMHWESSGAWTGEISPPMIVEAGCRYIELAHSERLMYFGETYDFVRRKVNTALSAGLVPILCLGELADEKAQGQADRVIGEQMLTALRDVAPAHIPDVVLAYEPRWAIGSKEAAHSDYVSDRHRYLRNLLLEKFGAGAAENTRILYGGSVTSENGRDLVRLPDVDGLFIGRAAWTAEGFAELIHLVAEEPAGKA